MKQSVLTAAFVTLAGFAMAETPTLSVYTYDSFMAEWGPGPAVEAAFEQTCDCNLEFVGVGDGAALLARLQLEGPHTDADIVLGLDTSLIAIARETGLFAPHSGIPENLDLPVSWSDDTFLPFDWGYFAFVYDKTRLSNPPSSFAELIGSNTSILIQDPRSSTPGLGLLMWMKSVYGDDAGSAWAELSPQIVTVTKGWSEAYGMFLDGEADMVLSYTTSPAYHLIAENDDSKAAANFSDGHYMQIEVAGKIAGTDQNALADEFLDFMLSDAFQAVIPTNNWMYPAIIPDAGLPEEFKSLITPDKALLTPIDDVPDLRKEALAEWLAALSQ